MSTWANVTLSSRLSQTKKYALSHHLICLLRLFSSSLLCFVVLNYFFFLRSLTFMFSFTLLDSLDITDASLISASWKCAFEYLYLYMLLRMTKMSMMVWRLFILLFSLCCWVLFSSPEQWNLKTNSYPVREWMLNFHKQGRKTKSDTWEAGVESLPQNFDSDSSFSVPDSDSKSLIISVRLYIAAIKMFLNV